MTTPDDVVAAVEQAIAGARPLVAVGGGADSAVALWGARQAAGTARAAFVDHGLAGSSQLDDASAALCRALAVERIVLAAGVEDGPDLERRARDARYAALREALGPGELIVTGHTMTDQAETVLMQLIRGAGARGLAGMATRGDDLARPLLAFSRDEVRRLAMTLGLPFTDDPANRDPRFTRNRIRGEVMPVFERLRPGSERAMARAAAHLAGDDAYIEAAAAEVPVTRDEGAVLVPVPVLATVAAPVAARAILRALHLDGGGATAADVEAVRSVVGGGSRRAQLTGDRRAEREGPFVAIWRSPIAVPGPVTLSIPGARSFGSHRVAIEPAGAGGPPAHLIDASALPRRVEVRAAAAGDRIDIESGTKLVSDALAEAGVPRRLRPAWPVVVAGGKIAAVPAVRVSSWARAGSGEALRVSDERAPG